MNYAIAIVVIVIVLIALKLILKVSMKIFGIIFIIFILAISATAIIMNPKMHKEFNFNIIEQVIKINPDGTTSIIETTTTNQRVRK